jgi:carboxypeptidase Q
VKNPTRLALCFWLLAATAGATDSEAARYRSAASRLVGASLVEGQAYALAQHLCDGIGPRLSGSAGLEAAVAAMAERLRGMGLETRTEPVMVPHWVRGEETAMLTSPSRQKLAVTALGGSVGTPPGGVSASVVEVASLEELRALGPEKVHGKIVLFNKAIAPGSGFEGYSAVTPLRGGGPSEAARLGAVATLVRSLGTYSLRVPHTGGMRYAPDAPRVPAAAVTAEDADLLHRLLADGQVVSVRLVLGCQTLPDAESANVVADLVGREKPEEIVLLGAHLDSWDLGTGAIDDAAGVGIVVDAVRLMKATGLVPRRTVRVVLYTNEENGLRGGRAYAALHADELPRHVAAIEADSGAGAPLGFAVHAGAGGLAVAGEIAGLLQILGVDSVRDGSEGADISALKTGGVPRLGLLQDERHYFDWHHTPADTFDKINPREIAESTAAVAVMAYVLAEREDVLPRPAPEPAGTE